MNKTIMMGRLTRDPLIRYGGQDNQMAIASFSLAVDRKYKNKNNSDVAETDFFNCTAFGKLGEFAEKYLKHGTKVLAVGHLQNNSYTNRDGNKVYSVQIILEEIEFAESKKKQEENAEPPASGDGFMQVPDGVDDVDLPFN